MIYYPNTLRPRNNIIMYSTVLTRLAPTRGRGNNNNNLRDNIVIVRGA